MINIDLSIARRSAVQLGQEDTDLAVIDLAQPAAPLPGHAAGRRALLGKPRPVQDEDPLVVAQFLGDVAPQFAPDGVVVPPAGADEQLQGPPFEAGLGGDGLGGLALEASELALEDDAGVLALLLAVEEGEVAPDEVLQAGGAGVEVVGGELGIAEQGPGVGVIEQVHSGLRKLYRRQASRNVTDRLG